MGWQEPALLTGALTHDEARTIEAKQIRKRLADARRDGLIDGTEPIEEQLQKAGLLNKNRGRDPDSHPKGWLDIDPDDYLEDIDDVFDIQTPNTN